ncbi:MAG TPA: AGE family epimerase/isomerase, partial [Gammaproteobacteria bacterium]
YWELDYRGEVVNSKKHVYAQAFAIYALCAYHRLTGSEDALFKALALYERIEVSALDSENGGYHEAFSRSWSEVRDVALSAGEPNYPKTMNTHLHLFEAYTALYAVHPRENIRFSLKGLLECFVGNIINSETHHLRIYFDDAWRDRSTVYSYGHDIECSWLLWESAQAIGDEQLLSSLTPVILDMVNACLDCRGENGEIPDGYNLKEHKRIEARPWWAQAEALVGFLNAYTMTGDMRYFQAFESVWVFIKKYQRDWERGEWFWYSLLDGKKSPYKMGFWKAPYHNGRAMLEVCRRLRQVKCRAN